MSLNHVILGAASSCALLAGGFVACGGGTTPTGPPSTPPPVTTTTTTTPPIQNPGCYPSPPPLYGINAWIQSNGDGHRRVLDSRPWVVNMNDFCAAAGYLGDYRFCRTRTEAAPDMAACDQMAVGRARDTGRWGPTWYYNDRLCDSGNPGCTNHPENQFLVIAKGQGKYTVCAADTVPVSQIAGLEGSRCDDCTLREGSDQCE